MDTITAHVARMMLALSILPRSVFVSNLTTFAVASESSTFLNCNFMNWDAPSSGVSGKFQVASPLLEPVVETTTVPIIPEIPACGN